MNLEEFSKALIIGLGRSGMSVLRFLSNLGMEVAVSESRSKERISRQELAELDQVGAKVEWGGHTDTLLEPGCLVVPSPGVSLDLDLLQRAQAMGCTVAGELALAAGRFPVPVIAVTGTNGKTTVTELIGHLLAAEFGGDSIFVGGNIGRPLLDFFHQPKQYGMAVLEVSSFQLDLSGTFRPNVGLLLNLSPDHLDRHGTMTKYAAAKARLFVNQKAGDLAVLGGDDPLAAGTKGGGGRKLFFGAKPGCEASVTDSGVVLDCVLHSTEVQEAYDLRVSRMTSWANRLNAAAAVLTARYMGCGREAVRRALQSNVPPMHRMQEVGQFRGITFVDDSKATNVGAMTAAVSGQNGPVILIAGGQAKGCDFTSVVPVVEQQVKSLVLLGEDAGMLAEIFQDRVPVRRAESMIEAVEIAVEQAEPGDTVLLAPGCASFDMFSGYGERGEMFTRAVETIIQGGSDG
jgi:UDP-N-acetylmuramoylalanine--D-glutamate ligase